MVDKERRMTTTPTTQQTAPSNPTSQSASAVATNGVRLTAVAEKLASHFHGSLTLNTTELFQLCYALARGIDYALSSNDVPRVAHSIPVLIKKMFQHKNESALHSSLMVLIISAKNACNKGWFQEDDRREILALANDFSSSFCLSVSQNPDAIDTLAAISEITPRFYPQLKLTKLIVSFEAKPGYDILMSDFFIQRNIPLNEKIRLYVIQRGNLETSSCITQPPLVSFLVNGKGVEKRNNVAMETGPQVPTDITKMLKYGTNIIQAAGYFNGNYIVAIAFTSTSSIASPILQDYTEPSAEIESDSEIIEGPSTVSLNCPISFGRIKTPVKGSQCRHPQCFDYDNYMEINSRKPIWRCPHCNRPACALEIRLDQKMVKILKEVDNNASHITMLSDGSWKKVEEHDKNQQSSCPLGEKKDKNNNSKGDDFNDIIDLTSEENDVIEPIDVEDTKPILDCQVSSIGPQVNTVQPSHPQTSIFHAAEDNAWIRNSFSPAYGTLESVLPDSLRSRTGPSSSYLQQEIQRQSGPLRMPSVPRHTMQMPVSMQAPPTPTGNPSRRVLLHPPSTATVTVAANGNFASAHASRPSSFVVPQNRSQNQIPANRTYQATTNVSAQRPIAPASSTHRVANSFRAPPSIINSSNPSANNVSTSLPSHQPLFPPVRMPTSIQGSLRTHTQPSSMTPLSENASGLAQSAMPEIPPEHDWRPTGRMRGSLTGDAYSAALNNYLVSNTPNPSNNSNPNLNPNTSSNAPSTLGQTGRRWYQ